MNNGDKSLLSSIKIARIAIKGAACVVGVAVVLVFAFGGVEAALDSLALFVSFFILSVLLTSLGVFAALKIEKKRSGKK